MRAEPEFLLSPIRGDMDLTSFHCGVASLDTWLTTMAARADAQDIARVRVWTRPSPPNP
ncbi:MAG: hypothetical protein LBR32_01445 [Propionibacteriaceae bacterium]|jgi:hypothetical protein|nr:hypothetical protein [Propionibacteriaceae bacterium]